MLEEGGGLINVVVIRGGVFYYSRDNTEGGVLFGDYLGH